MEKYGISAFFHKYVEKLSAVSSENSNLIIGKNPVSGEIFGGFHKISMWNVWIISDFPHGFPQVVENMTIRMWEMGENMGFFVEKEKVLHRGMLPRILNFPEFL